MNYCIDNEVNLESILKVPLNRDEANYGVSIQKHESVIPAKINESEYPPFIRLIFCYFEDELELLNYLAFNSIQVLRSKKLNTIMFMYINMQAYERL